MIPCNVVNEFGDCKCKADFPHIDVEEAKSNDDIQTSSNLKD